MENADVIFEEKDGKIFIHFPKSVEPIGDIQNLYENNFVIVAWSDEFKNLDISKMSDVKTVVKVSDGVTTFHFENEVIFHNNIELEHLSLFVQSKSFDVIAFSGEFKDL